MQPSGCSGLERLLASGSSCTALQGGSPSHGACSVDSRQAACCCTSRTSLRSWGCAVSLVLTAPRPASVASLSSWMAAPGTSAARTARASTCCGTARSGGRGPEGAGGGRAPGQRAQCLWGRPAEHPVNTPRLRGAMPVSARGSCWRPSTGVGRSAISATNSVCYVSTASRTSPTWTPRVGLRAS